MENYLKLTTSEAIQHFLNEYNFLFPKMSSNLIEKLNHLNHLENEVHVSITLPTHHVKPDYLKDVIVLKNLISKTEKKLHEMVDKRLAARVIENIKCAQESIDYSLNNDGLVLYATESFSTVVKIPVELSEEVIIGQYFNLIPLYKALLQIQRYFILTVSRQKIRLLEVFNDQLVQEIDNEDFPFINTHYYTEDWLKLAQDSFMENQYKEYFNIADKKFQTYFNEFPLPVILMGDVKGLSYYHEQMDNGKIVIGEVPGSYDTAPIHEILEVVCPVVQAYRENRQRDYWQMIDNGESAHLLSFDIRDIYRMVDQGNVDALFIGNNYSLNGEVLNDNVKVEDRINDEVQTNDLLADLLHRVRKNGGRILFMEDELLAQYEGIVMVRRY